MSKTNKMSKKITSVEELKNLRDRVRTEIELREGPKAIQITVHMGTCGIAAGARDILNQLAAAISEEGVDTVTLRQSGCLGLCDQEPMLTLVDASGNEYRYVRLDREKARGIVREHVVNGNPLTEYLIEK